MGSTGSLGRLAFFLAGIFSPYNEFDHNHANLMVYNDFPGGWLHTDKYKEAHLLVGFLER
jgi:hypothetical protein